MKQDRRFNYTLFSLVFLFLPIQAERIITSSDIARWYLDSDLVITSTLIEQQANLVRSIDTSRTDGYSFKCDILKDKYIVVIDSTLKGFSSRDTIIITTPEYSHNCRKYRITENSGIEIGETGDTIRLSSIEVVPDNCDLGHYYRIGAETKNIILLKSVLEGYETIFVMQGVKDADLLFLKHVSMKGENYFRLD